MLTMKIATWWRITFEFLREKDAQYAVRVGVFPAWRLAHLQIRCGRRTVGMVVDLKRKRGGDS
jgi:hypothetical protein